MPFVVSVESPSSESLVVPIGSMFVVVVVKNDDSISENVDVEEAMSVPLSSMASTTGSGNGTGTTFSDPLSVACDGKIEDNSEDDVIATSEDEYEKESLATINVCGMVVDDVTVDVAAMSRLLTRYRSSWPVAMDTMNKM